MKRGKFIVIDGVDGAGKTQQLFRLAEHLRAAYPDNEFAVSREPGGSFYAEEIRGLILNNQHAKAASAGVFIQLFGAARFDHLERMVLPSIERGTIVLCDRFESSTYAFQLVAQQGGADILKFFHLQREIFLKKLPSWKTIILDVSVEVAMRRSAQRDEAQTHFDERKQAFHEAVRCGFAVYARNFPEARATIVDASRSIDEVFTDVLAIVKEEMGV